MPNPTRACDEIGDAVATAEDRIHDARMLADEDLAGNHELIMDALESVAAAMRVIYGYILWREVHADA